MSTESVKIESIKLLVLLLSLFITLATTDLFNVTIRVSPLIVSLLSFATSLILSYMYLMSSEEIQRKVIYKSSLYFDLVFIIYLFGSFLNNLSIDVIEINPYWLPEGILVPSLVITIYTILAFIKFSYTISLRSKDSLRLIKIDHSEINNNYWILASFFSVCLYILLSTFIYHIM